MTSDPKRAQAVFLAAIQLSDSTKRLELLQIECGDDIELRLRVEALLNAHEATGGFGADSQDFSLAATTENTSAAMHAGTMIAGRYKLIQAIGEGGMGSVWLAEQKEPVKRKVAIKLIKAGMDSAQVLARFQAERQALAMMDHQNIAKVFDGGMNEQGRPYFVMEFVKGVPLTEYCDTARLTLKERLELFMPVCQAVQHAHQKGIIHRDLKPSNILICLYDGKPVPKVIDFGLAKAMHQSLTDQSLHTAIGMMVGTPLYMSPEQAELNNLDVDTRTDIYSLGVILYELMTGSTPLEKQQLKVAAFNEILRLIREVEPPRPSTRLSGSASLPSIAAQRKIEPKQLSKSLTGDLDWIIMKALDKERSRRYETANGLARDIERCLSDEAVEAAPPTTSYRLKKFAIKHRTFLSTSAAFLLVLFVGTGVSSWLAIRATRAENEAQQFLQAEATQRKLAETNEDAAKVSAEFARLAQLDADERRIQAEQQRGRAEQREQDAIKAVNQFGSVVAQNPELKNNPQFESLRKTLLQEPIRFLQSLRDQLQGDMETRPESLESLARVAFDLGTLSAEIGDKQIAIKAVEESRNLYERLASANPTDLNFKGRLAGSHVSLSALFRSMGNLPLALVHCEKAIEIRETLVSANPKSLIYLSDLGTNYSNCGTIQRELERPGDALASFQKGLEISERIANENPEEGGLQNDLAGSRSNLAVLYADKGNAVGAIAELKKSLDILKRLVESHPGVVKYRSSLAIAHQNLGTVLSRSGMADAAMASHKSALDIIEKLADENPSVTLFQQNLGDGYVNLGIARLTNGKNDDAQAAFEKGLAARTLLAKRNPTVLKFQIDLAHVENHLGLMFVATGKSAEATPHLEQALRTLELLETENPDDVNIQSLKGWALDNLALVELKARRFVEARNLLFRAIKHAKRSLENSPNNPMFRGFIKGQYNHLLAAANGLEDAKLASDARIGLAELAANDQQFAAMDQRMAEVAAGAKPNNAKELVEFGYRCYDTRRFSQAAQWFGKSIENDAELAADRKQVIAYNAACCAALAANFEGISDQPFESDAQSKLRGQSLAWLRAELEHWKKLLEKGTPGNRNNTIETLTHWLQDSDLASLRGEAIDRLPELERECWRTFWSGVAELLQSTRGSE